MLCGIPAEASIFRQRGPASWYGPGFNGHTMANGETFWENDPTIAAYLRLPLGTVIRVKNLQNGKAIVMLVADHGPYCCKDIRRIIDVSRAASIELGFEGAGLATVEITRVNNFEDVLVRPKKTPEPIQPLAFVEKVFGLKIPSSSFKIPVAIGSPLFKTRKT